MSRVDSFFSNPGHKAVIPYITVGYPDIESTLKAVPVLEKNGADIIELGIPYSDPLADGVTIQESSYQALQNGVTPEMCFDIAGKVRQKTQLPLVFMTYYNPVLSYGEDRFCLACVNAGIDGLIVPDLPPEEGNTLESAAKKAGLNTIYLLAPTSNPERIRMVAEKSSGFIYVVSVTGVTGARTSLPETLKSFLTQVRQITEKPLCVGFGISTPEQARQIAHISDGVIVGSKLINLMKTDRSLASLGDFMQDLRKAVDS